MTVVITPDKQEAALNASGDPEGTPARTAAAARPKEHHTLTSAKPMRTNALTEPLETEHFIWTPGTGKDAVLSPGGLRVKTLENAVIVPLGETRSLLGFPDGSFFDIPAGPDILKAAAKEAKTLHNVYSLTMAAGLSLLPLPAPKEHKISGGGEHSLKNIFLESARYISQQDPAFDYYGPQYGHGSLTLKDPACLTELRDLTPAFTGIKTPENTAVKTLLVLKDADGTNHGFLATQPSGAAISLQDITPGHALVIEAQRLTPARLNALMHAHKHAESKPSLARAYTRAGVTEPTEGYDVTRGLPVENRRHPDSYDSLLIKSSHAVTGVADITPLTGGEPRTLVVLNKNTAFRCHGTAAEVATAINDGKPLVAREIDNVGLFKLLAAQGYTMGKVPDPKSETGVGMQPPSAPPSPYIYGTQPGKPEAPAP